MVVSQIRPQQCLCNSPANRLPSGKDSISQGEWKNKQPGELHRGSGGKAGPGRSPLKFEAVFPQTLPGCRGSHGSASPHALRPIPRLGDGWELGSAKPRSIRKDFLSQLQRPFQGGSLPLPTSTAGQPLSFPLDRPTTPCKPCAARVPSPRRARAYKGSLAPLSTYSTYTPSLGPGSTLTPSPLLQPQIFQWLHPTSIRRRRVIPSPCFSTCSQRVEAHFNCLLP